MLTTIDEVLQAVRLKLPDYLIEKGVADPYKKFSCIIDPSHNDTDASCSLHKSQIFITCFGCNVSSDIFSLANKLEGLPITGPEFVTKCVLVLADRFGIKYSIAHTNEEKAALKYNYFRAYKLVADFIEAEAKNNPTEAFNKELTRRKWSRKDSIEYGLGCCNKHKDIIDLLHRHDFNNDFIELVGLNRADVFSPDNLIFTIRNERNYVCAFYARDVRFEEKKVAYEKAIDSLELIKPKAPMKYNSTANFTGIYEKPLHPYGISDVKDFHKVMLVEGHGCKHSLKLNDVHNVIALGGLALSDATIDKLIGLGATALVLCLDNDDKGRSRTKEIITKYYGRKPIDFFVIDMSSLGNSIKDPDEAIRKLSIDAFRQIPEKNALEWYATQELYEKSDVYAVVETIAPLIALERSPINRLKIESIISDMTEIPKDVVHAEVEQRISVSKDRKSEYALKIFDEAKELISMNPDALSAAINLIETKVGALNTNSDNEDLFSSNECLKELAKIQEDEESEEQDPVLITGFNEFDKYIPLPIEEAFCLLLSPPNGCKCQKFDTLVQMPNGSRKKIEEIYKDKDKFVLTMNSDYTIGNGEVTDYIDSGILPTYRLKTNDGIENHPTSNHPFYTLDGWKMMSELKTGDKIAIVKNYSCFDNIDSSLSEDDATMIGLLLSDGSITQAAGFTNIDEELISLFKTLCIKKNPNTTFRYDGNFTNYAVDKTQQKNPILDWIKGFGIFGLNSHTKFIPDSIFESSKKKIAKFIGAMWACDGFVSIRKGRDGFRIGISLCNENMVTQMRSLLLRFGIKARIRKSYPSYDGGINRFEAWTLYISDFNSAKKFYDNIKIPLKYKQNAVDHIITFYNTDMVRESYNNTFPSELWNIIDQKCKANGTSITKVILEKIFPEKNHIVKRRLKKSNGEIYYYERLINKFKPKRHCNISTNLVLKFGEALNDDFLISLANGDIYFDEITEIEYEGMNQCYDLTIKDTHNFIANDFIVHNSSLCINTALGILENNSNAIVIIHTIDDSRTVYINRMIAALTRIKINWIKKPNTFLDKDMNKKRLEAYKIISEYIREGRLIIKDISHGGTVEYHGRLVQYVREKNPGKPMFVVCDNLHRLETEAGFEEGGRAKYKYISGLMKSYTTKYSCIEFNTVEMTKQGMYEKPTNSSSIAEAASLQFDANLILFIWNEVNVLREDAELTFDTKVMEYDKDAGYYYRDSINPVLEVLVLKNKLSEFKYSLFFKVWPELALLEEMTNIEAKEIVVQKRQSKLAAKENKKYKSKEENKEEGDSNE